MSTPDVQAGTSEEISCKCMDEWYDEMPENFAVIIPIIS